MTKKHSSVRIQGLVRLMNRVRDQLRAGVSVDEAEEMRAAVHDAVRMVEQVCRRHRMTPEQLPAPSRRAYAYLRDLVKSGALDDARLRVQSAEPGEGPRPPRSEIEISGIVAACNYYHREFAAVVTRSLAKRGPIDQAAVTLLAGRLHTATEAIKALCEESHGTPADLRAPSRRGYGWMRYLSNPESLTRHLETLRTFTGLARTRLVQLALDQPTPTLQAKIGATAVLYQTRIDGHVYQITLNEGFAGAPRQVIDALVHATLDVKNQGESSGDRSKAVETIRSYSKGEAFAEIQVAMHAKVLAPTHHAVGQYHDLNMAFERVNTAYFEGKLDRPHLEWNRTRTHRKYGHYDEARDTLMVSQTLDAGGVPEYVIDFVVYHELLHKSLGTSRVAGRRQMHTSAFRKAERDFQQYAEARRFIAKLSSQTKVEL